MKRSTSYLYFVLTVFFFRFSFHLNILLSFNISCSCEVVAYHYISVFFFVFVSLRVNLTSVSCCGICVVTVTYPSTANTTHITKIVFESISLNIWLHIDNWMILPLMKYPRPVWQNSTNTVLFVVGKSIMVLAVGILNVSQSLANTSIYII